MLSDKRSGVLSTVCVYESYNYKVASSGKTKQKSKVRLSLNCAWLHFLNKCAWLHSTIGRVKSLLFIRPESRICLIKKENTPKDKALKAEIFKKYQKKKPN